MKTKKIMMLGFALVLGLGIGFAQADIDTGLIGYWPMDGDYEDAAGNNHGTLVDDPDIDLPNGAPSFDNDVKFPNFSTSLRIPATLYGAGYVDPLLANNDWHDPADDYVDLGSAPEHDAVGSGDWTIAAWVKTQAEDGMIFGNGGDDGTGVRMYLGIGETGDSSFEAILTVDDNSSKIQARVGTGGQRLDDNQWHHLVGMRRGLEIRLYVDSVFQDSRTLPGGYDISGMTQANSYIGCGYTMSTGANRSYNGVPHRQHKQFRDADGLVDEVKLYNRALTDADVVELFNDDSGSAGNKRPKIMVPDEQVLIGAPVNLQLTCTVSDDGLPLPVNPGSPNPNDPNKLRWVLTAESWPTTSSGVVFSGNPTSGEAFTYEGSANPPDTVFTCDPTVTLDVPGLYVFKFSADDKEKDSNTLFQVKVYPTGYEGLILHYSFDGMSTGDKVVEDIAVDPFTFDPVTGIPIRYDHDGTVMTGNPAWDPNITQGPENDGIPPDVDILQAGVDLNEAIEFDAGREQWVACEHLFDIVDIPDPNLPIRGNSPRTFMCWAWTEAFNNGGLWDMGNYSNGQNFCLRTRGGMTDTWRVQLWGFPAYDFDVTYPSLATWVHFALVYDGAHIDVYADGKLIGGKDIALNTGSNVALRLAVYNNLNNFYDGVIDDFRVYNRALSAAEIIDAANIGNLAPEADAGPDLLLVEDVGGSSIQITGATWNDVPGSVTIQWTQLSGPGTATINNDTTIDPTVDFSGQPYGLYEFELRVSDGIDPVNLPDAVDTMLIFIQAKSSYGLMGQWKLDESTGATAFDSSGNDLDGTLIGDPNLPVWQPAGGKVDGALQFINTGDDVGQNVVLSDVPGIDDLTVSLWMKADDLFNASLLDKLGDDDTGWGINLSENGQVALQVGPSAVSANSAYAADEWVHVAATFDGTADEGKIFINGLEQNSSSGITASAKNMLPPLTLGGSLGAGLAPLELAREAESFENASIAPMTVVSDGGASGGQVIQAASGIGNSNSDPTNGIATYTIDVEGGTYAFVARVRRIDSDSMWLRISGWTTAAGSPAPITRGDGWVKWDWDGSQGPWFWQTLDNQDSGGNTVIFDLAPGTHTVELARREDGTQMDWWGITKDLGADINALPDEMPSGGLFRGLADHIRLYDTVLSELEIALLAVGDGVVMEGCNLNIEGTQMASDLDGNCYVDVRDLKILLGNWLLCTDLNNPNCN